MPPEEEKELKEIKYTKYDLENSIKEMIWIKKTTPIEPPDGLSVDESEMWLMDNNKTLRAYDVAIQCMKNELEKIK
jgi:hypothetical protein